MSAWPKLDRQDDQRLALSLAAGESDALAYIVDRYSARLYDYCHALLRDQETAAGALHDAFIAAYAHIGHLREPERFRSWLYALIRNECLRRLQDPERPTERVEAPEVEDVFLDADERAMRLEARQLVHSALSGLRGREREALDLLLRHDLDAAEIGGVLGVNAQEATDLVAEARRRLDDALAAALVARDGRDECPSVAALVYDGGWPLTPAVSRKLIRHIETCPTCTSRRDRNISTGRLLQDLPVALMPADLRSHILQTAFVPALRDDLAMIAQRAEPFDTWGWPVPVEQPSPRETQKRRSKPPGLLPAVAAATVVLLIVAGAFMWLPGGGSDRAGANAPESTTSAPDPSESPSESPEPTESEDPTESPTPTPTPTPTTSTPTPSPTPTPTPTRSRKPKPPSKSPERRGTLSVGGCAIKVGESSCPISVRAVGGEVFWSVTGTSGGVSASGRGQLGRGGSSSVTASRPSDCTEPGSGTVRFSPSGSATVTWDCEPPEGS
ncbi:RNA polymerase sigma factor [Actinomadura rudentiformis]|uniref:Sigma-70 family RNA polymerase sigma factor n=1 Tax=Actinomadura rudentiformis TaxID=359158 RepID=A0A6H9YXF1_9ACTN|nr:sigma-70 family RNA polymerase sigma factor [Actinomadura rudentiformis]KAB2347274.1 sigma-70 family RNA polymerase sigma factor [Actinomadura rudentiformis]